MAIRIDRLMEIGVIGYVVIAVAQVVSSDGATQVPAWVAAMTRGMGG